MDHDGQDIDIQFFGQVKSAFMKTLYHAIFRPGAFREYNNEYPFFILSATRSIFCLNLFGRKIICQADHLTKKAASSISCY